MSNKIIFALDFPSSETACAFVKPLMSKLAMVKIGLELFTGEGPQCVYRFVNDIPVFLDLKLHDIPKTVERATAQAVGLGVKYVTVHAAGGSEMVRRAVDVTRDSNTEIIAVTMLTSLDDNDLDDMFIDRALNRVEYSVGLAKNAYKQGVRNFVCSPQEASYLAAIAPDIKIICPGIRRAAGVDDQKRTATAAEAIAAGAHYLVVGRPIKKAHDPKQALDELNAEIANST